MPSAEPRAPEDEQDSSVQTQIDLLCLPEAARNHWNICLELSTWHIVIVVDQITVVMQTDEVCDHC